MAQHGYLHDTYDNGDFGRDDDRERDRSSRSEDRNSDRWRSEDRDRGMMFGDHDHDRDDDRGVFSRMSDEFGSWFDDDERQRHGRGRSSAGQQDSRERYSAHPDDHYRSWRDKQVQQLDNDYRDYCREREQQFHQDFDSWRQNRRGQQAGRASSSGANDELMLDRNAAGMSTDAPQEPMSSADTDSAATLGTTPEASGRNRK